MPKAIIANFPRPYLKRLRSLLESGECTFRPGWDVTFTQPPSSKHSFPFEINLRELEKELPSTDVGDGPHILSFKSPKDDQRIWLVNKTVPFFRLRWLDNRLCKGTQKEDLERVINSINEILLQEDEWSILVKPHDKGSPLLLPSSQFRAQREHQSLWNHASAADQERIRSFPKRIDAFRRTHLETKEDHRKVWIDEIDHIYDWHGEMHGVAPPPRCWKYSYLIPRGFHFDVTSRRSPRIELTAVDGVTTKADHLNVDAHGYIICPPA